MFSRRNVESGSFSRRAWASARAWLGRTAPRDLRFFATSKLQNPLLIALARDAQYPVQSFSVKPCLDMQTPGTDDTQPPNPAFPIAQHGSTSDRPSKRQRLSLACNECRKRKVKCDSEMPKCRNCRVRGQICETTDPKHPELVVVRKYGAMEGDFRDESYGIHSDFCPAPMVQHEPSTPASVSLPREQSRSWVARSYQAHRTLENAPTVRPEEASASFDNATASRQSRQESLDSPEMTVNIDSSNSRQKVMGGSSSQSLSMFLDLYLQKSKLPGIRSYFRYGMAFAEEFILPLSLSLPDLPPHSLLERYIDAYTRNIHPLYPLLDLEQLHDHVQRIRSSQDATWSPSGGFSGLR